MQRTADSLCLKVLAIEPQQTFGMKRQCFVGAMTLDDLSARSRIDQGKTERAHCSRLRWFGGRASRLP